MNLNMDHVGSSPESSDAAIADAARKATDHTSVQVLEVWFDVTGPMWHALVSERRLPDRHQASGSDASTA